MAVLQKVHQQLTQRDVQRSAQLTTGDRLEEEWQLQLKRRRLAIVLRQRCRPQPRVALLVQHVRDEQPQWRSEEQRREQQQLRARVCQLQQLRTTRKQKTRKRQPQLLHARLPAPVSALSSV
jgi:hypothetical protein